MLHPLALDEPGRLDGLLEPVSADLGEHALALGPVAEDQRAQLGLLFTRQPQRGDEGGYALLGDVPAGKDHQRLGLDRRPRLARALVLALDHSHLAPEPLRPQAPRGEGREAERPLGDAQAGALDRRADRPPYRPRYSRQPG